MRASFSINVFFNLKGRIFSILFNLTQLLQYSFAVVLLWFCFLIPHFLAAYFLQWCQKLFFCKFVNFCCTCILQYCICLIAVLIWFNLLFIPSEVVPISEILKFKYRYFNFRRILEWCFPRFPEPLTLLFLLRDILLY